MCSKRPEFVGSKRLLVHPQPMKIEGYPSKGTDGVLETRSEGLIGVNNLIQPPHQWNDFCSGNHDFDPKNKSVSS